MNPVLLMWISKSCLELFGEAPLGIQEIPQDGSQRRFHRVQLSGGSIIVIENPGQFAENDAYWEIGKHLRRCGVPVPELYRYNREKGWIITQDLGTQNLMDAVGRTSDKEAKISLYGRVMEILLGLQIRAREGFPFQWCCQSPLYDKELMVERESGYFLEAFLKGYCRWEGDELLLRREFEELASKAETLALPKFLIHRDFQSRNLLVDARGRIGVVDFQGARMGPLQYDVASLVLDPYVDLPMSFREELVELYLDNMRQRCKVSHEEFLEGYPLIALHRSLQVLGAFAFLGGVKGKVFFLGWIPRALGHLRYILNRNPQWPCPYLREVVEEVSDLVLRN